MRPSFIDVNSVKVDNESVVDWAVERSRIIHEFNTIDHYWCERFIIWPEAFQLDHMCGTSLVREDADSCYDRQRRNSTRDRGAMKYLDASLKDMVSAVGQYISVFSQESVTIHHASMTARNRKDQKNRMASRYSIESFKQITLPSLSFSRSVNDHSSVEHSSLNLPKSAASFSDQLVTSSASEGFSS